MESRLSIPEAYASALKILGDKATQPAQLGEAIELLNKIRDAGQTSAQLESNLAKAYAKLENWPMAIEHFESAIHLDRWNIGLRQDLNFVQSKIEGNLGTAISHPAEWGQTLNSFLSTQELFAFSASVLWIVLFVWFRKRKLGLGVWIPSLSLIILLFGLSFFSLSGQKLAVMNSKTDEPLRSAPLENAEVLFQLKPATRLRILRVSDSYSEVERPNSFRGWIENKNLRQLKY